MGRNYNNGLYITGNFWQGVHDKYGKYFWEDQSCNNVVKILKFMLQMLEEDGYYPLTQDDNDVKKRVYSEWYWGHADEVVKMDYQIEKGYAFKQKITFERYFYVAYADILDRFLTEAWRCNSKSCNCWFQGTDNIELTSIHAQYTFPYTWDALNKIKSKR